MPPKRRNIQSDLSDVGTLLTPGRRPRGQTINHGLPPIGTAVSSSYGSGYAVTPKELAVWTGPRGEQLSTTLQNVIDRNNVFRDDHYDPFADPQANTEDRQEEGGEENKTTGILKQ